MCSEVSWTNFDQTLWEQAWARRNCEVDKGRSCSYFPDVVWKGMEMVASCCGCYFYYLWLKVSVMSKKMLSHVLLFFMSNEITVPGIPCRC